MRAQRLAIYTMFFSLALSLLGVSAAGAGTVEIENVSYSIQDPFPAQPTHAQVIVRATAMYTGTQDANDNFWIIGCFLNDSIGGDLNDTENPDFFDPQTNDRIDGPDDRISCPGVSALIPRCENGASVQFFGWTRAAILNFGLLGNEIAREDLEVESTNCGPAPGRVGGTVSGLGSNDGVRLRNFIRNNGTLVAAPQVEVDFPLTTFTFPDFVPIGHTYDVRVSAVTPNINCSVANGAGTMNGSDVNNVQVTCSCTQPPASDFVSGVVTTDVGVGGCQQSYPIGGQVSGLDNGEFLALANTLDPPGTPPPFSETLVVVNGGSSFQFPTPGAVGATYHVSVANVSGGKTCSVSGGSGTVSGPVNNIQVSCQCPSVDPDCGINFSPDDFEPFIQSPEGPGICDPFWNICGGGLFPWWWISTGPPTGQQPCQRTTVCEVCGESIYEDAEGNIIYVEEYCCTDQCVGSSASTIYLNGPATLVASPAQNETVHGVINVVGQASDAEGVKGFLFFVDNQAVLLDGYTFNGTHFSGRLDTRTLGEGVRELQVLSVDADDEHPVSTIYRRQIVVDNVGGGGAPEIDVFLNWNSTPIADGGGYVIGETTPPNVTISRRFRIENNGNAALSIGNPSHLVSGACFSQRAPIASSIPAGGAAHFWVDLNCPSDDTYEGLVTINNNDANEATYTFTIAGTVSTPTVNAPQITQQPTSQSGPVGSSVSFAVAASGPGPLTYRWFHNGLQISNGGHYSGVTSPTLTVSGIDASVVGSYRCEVTGAGGTTSSSAANLGLVGGSCVASSTTLCLQDDVFEARLTWLDPNTGVLHSGKSKPYSEESGFFYFFDPNNLEVGVKVLEGDVSWWVYYGGATNVQYTLSLTNTETGEVKTYFKPEGSTCGDADTETFGLTGNSPAQLWVPEGSTKSVGNCSPGAYQTCLLDDRFKVEVRRNGTPQPMVDLTPNSSLFWFFGPANAEGLVKMVDATAPPFNQYWVLFGSLTHLGFEVVVTDTVTGQVNTYASSDSHCGGADSSAFPP